jgi:ferredoxin
MKVSVDVERCRGHGLCCIICPDLFTLTDDGYTVVSTPDVPMRFEEAVGEAEHACPEKAITVS